MFLNGAIDDYYIGDFSFYPENWGDKVIYEHPGYYSEGSDMKDFYGVLKLTESTVANWRSLDCPTGVAADCEAVLYLHIWIVDDDNSGCRPDRHNQPAFSGDYSY